MPKYEKLAGATSEIWLIFISDSSKTDGSGLAGLTNASAGLTAYYMRNTDTGSTAISLVSMTLGTFTSGGFKEMDATNMPGWYQFCPPNAAIASGAKAVAIHLKGATNMAPLPLEVQLVTNFNPDAALQGFPSNFASMVISAAGLVSTAQITLSGTASAGSSSTITLTGGIATDNYYNAQAVLIMSGTGAGQARVISGYVGSTKIATVGRNWATAPDGTSVFVVIGVDAPVVDSNNRIMGRIDAVKNVALSNFEFDMTDGGTHLPLTGLVDANFTIKHESIDGASGAALSGTITEVDATHLPGTYKISFTAAEMNGSVITMAFQTASSDLTKFTFKTSD